jgi:hypothetical protein
MEPPHNKLITSRTSFLKGTCPPSADSGQVPKVKEDKLTKVLASARDQKIQRGPWQDFPRFARDKLTKVLVRARK